MVYSLSEVVNGMRHGQLRLALEPQVHLETGQIIGFECLSRWAHPRDGLVSPALFLPQLERHGLIGQLTLVIIERALSIRSRLRERGLDVAISVNISSQSLLDWNFPADLLRLPRAAGGDLQGLTLEITESAELSDDSLSGECIRALKSLGLRLSLDDFWTGYSSLSKPHLDAFDEVKIDYQLTRHIEDDKIALAGVSSIHTFARMLGWRCVVEGIENLQSVSLLRALGCSVGQGYLFAHPIDEDDLEAWLDARAPKGYLEFLHQGSAAPPPALPLLDELQIASHSRSSVPIWLFDIDRMKMHWANPTALRLWMAEDVAEFTARDFSTDMSDAIYQRLLSLRELLRSGGTIAEQWTIYPRGAPKQVYSVMKASLSMDGHFLLEVRGYEGIGPAAAMPSGTPTADTLPNPSLAVHEDGRIYWRNAATSRTFARLGDCLFDACTSPADAAGFVSDILRHGSGTTDLRIRNHRCSIPFRVEGLRVRDPSTGKKAVVLTLTQACDIYGCSHRTSQAAPEAASLAGP